MYWRTICGLVLAAAVASAAELPDAAEHRDKNKVAELLRSGADVNAAQTDGTTALHWAVYYDDAETVAALIRKGANVKAVNRYGVSPLSEACKNGNAAIVKLLLEAGADAKATLKGGETMLMLAARAGSDEAVKALLRSGADANATERLGQTALMWAAAEGQSDVVRTLLESGADPSAKISSGFTAFFFAVREGRLDTVRAFLAAGTDVNAMAERPTGRRGGGPRMPGTSPLMLAVQNAHFELAIALVDAGADPNDVRTGLAPLHMLAGVRRPDSSDISDGAPASGEGGLSSADFVRAIVKRGANVNLRLPKGVRRPPNTSSLIEAEGATPILFAADRSDVPLMRLLIELGADPNIPNFNNTTPLLAAAGVGTVEPQEEAGEESEALEAVRLLLDLGADVNAVDNNGDTAMHGAAYNIAPTVVKLLAERGADPKIWGKRNKFDRTPLFIAEGFSGRLPRPDAATIAIVTKLMDAAGLTTEGERPIQLDIYAPAPAGTPPAQ